jgi:hypothetical protein
VKGRDVATSTADVSTSARVGDRYTRLAQGLTAKAEALASGLIGSVNDPLPKPRADPVSVTYDYKTGIKTVAYSGGSFHEELFNPTTMRHHAATVDSR